MTRPPSAIDDVTWDRLRYRGGPLREHVLAEPLDPTAPLLDDRVWQSFKEQCSADGNVIPQLIAHLEPQDNPGMFRRRGPRKAKGDDPFGDLLPFNGSKQRRHSSGYATSGRGIYPPGGVPS